MESGELVLIFGGYLNGIWRIGSDFLGGYLNGIWRIGSDFCWDT